MQRDLSEDREAALGEPTVMLPTVDRRNGRPTAQRLDGDTTGHRRDGRPAAQRRDGGAPSPWLDEDMTPLPEKYGPG